MGNGGARAALDIDCNVQGVVSAPPPSSLNVSGRLNHKRS